MRRYRYRTLIDGSEAILETQDDYVGPLSIKLARRVVPDWIETEFALIEEIPKEVPVEGMPGTWSHCGNQRVHGPHRHTVSFNEGPTPNVLCKGTPGDPDGDAPYGELIYRA